jgi:hypothetical protein
MNLRRKRQDLFKERTTYVDAEHHSKKRRKKEKITVLNGKNTSEMV